MITHRLLRGFLYAPLLLAAVAGAHPTEIRFLNWEGTENALKFDSRGRTVTVRADENSLSPPYAYEGPAVLVLFKEVRDGDHVVRKTAATLTIPGNMTHAIVILAAKDADAGTYNALLLDDSPASRPAGTIRLVNLSHLFVAFKINSDAFVMAPSETHQLAVDGALQRILAQAAARVGDDRWELVANNPLPVRPGLRLLLVLRDGRPQPGSKTNLVDMLPFYDRSPAASAELASTRR